MAVAKDMTGKIVGKWEVLGRDPTPRKNVHWLCRCECGSEASVSGNHLRRENSLSCRKCSESKDKGRLSSRVWERMVYRAKKKGLPVDVDQGYLYDLLVNVQKNRCNLSGVPIVLASTIRSDRAGATTASLDRVDSSRGYVKGNVQWLHKDVNKMKMQYDQSWFVEMCGKISDKARNKAPE